jgi:hypothetical protein
MRLVLVHGAAQGGRSSKEVQAEWLNALGPAFRTAGMRLPTDLDVRVPFYGDRLDSLVALSPEGIAIPRGRSEDRADSAYGALALELVGLAGVTDADIAAATRQGAVARGPENIEWVQTALRLATERAPWLTEKFLARFLADVHAYLTRVDVSDAINAIVASALDSGPAVVVSHSLGTVVAYWALRTVSSTTPVPLLVTLGSPLGLKFVKDYLPRPIVPPKDVRRWLNAADERDPVALRSRLDRDVFPGDVENLSDVHNPKANPHSISGYLSDAVVAKRIAEAITSP